MSDAHDRDAVNAARSLAERVADLARARGADDAEVVVVDSSELTAKVRMGEPEHVQEASSRAVGLRVFKDQRSAVTYSSDMRDDALAALVAESVTLAELSEPDELNRLPAAGELARGDALPELDLYDDTALGVDARTALDAARDAEAAALAFDPRLTNSEGGTWTRDLGITAFANTAGFCGGYRHSYVALYVEVVCDDADGKKRNGHWWTAARHLADLEGPEAVGREAARRTLASLGSRKVDTCEVPIVFEPEAGRAIVGMVFAVANGGAFYRKTSYLLGREGETVASPLVTISDEPLIRRGPGSRPFDGDGLPTRTNVIIDGGRLDTVLCDVYSARKLGRSSTASAGRGIGGNPAPTTSNLIMQPGDVSRDDLIRSTGRGFYVTSMMGFGFNPVTGDFSRGAAGFWIEGGELTHPVSEVTISANFDQLLRRIDGVADDLDRRASTQCPSFRVTPMTVAGR